jgi:ParB-like chromosome segregation protein Spo0J
MAGGWRATSLLARPDGMAVVMLPRAALEKNPYNEQIYKVGNLELLKEDIRASGVRQPLEVVADPENAEKWVILSGHRRLAACTELANEGSTAFEKLPCVILEGAKTENDRKIALITANATARVLTDGERLAQYEALKQALTERKKAGDLHGKVRDEMGRILNVSTGILGRMNAIGANCTEEVRQMVRDEQCTLTRAYEASRLPQEQQAEYARTGILPAAKKAERKAERKPEAPRKSSVAPELADCESWPVTVRIAHFGMIFAEKHLPDGRKIVAEIDTKAPEGSAGRVRFALVEKDGTRNGWSKNGKDCVQCVRDNLKK